jgi:hypothetical protein
MPDDDLGADLRSAQVMLTIPEARAILRISVNSGYELARRFRVTGGRFGIPNAAVGGRYIVPRERLLRWIEDQARGSEGPAA